MEARELPEDLSWAELVEELELDVDDEEDLTELDLSGRNLKNLPHCLWEMDTATSLALEDNQLESLPEGVGSLGEHLEELYLKNNRLRTLPEAMGQLRALDALYLEGNTLTVDSFPEAMGDMENLRGITLQRNALVAFPTPLLRLEQMEELFLDDNAIERLPSAFCDLVNLKELSVKGNRLTQLPRDFGRLTKLQIFHAEDNAIEKVPKSFGDCEALRRLYLQNNQLTKLHACIGRCTRLETLNVEFNRIEKVAKRIGELPRLKYLLLAHNAIRSLPFNPTKTAPGLRRLTLAGNDLQADVASLEAQVGEGLSLGALAEDENGEAVE